MQYHARHVDWLEGPIAERMSFSSFSTSVDDIWAHDVVRPYQIILLPGYEVPTSLSKTDKDALWLENTAVLDRARIVWDGFCPIALFEIIRECFDPMGSSKFIAVRDARSRRIVRDERDPSVLAIRPVRKPDMSQTQLHNHVTELLIWSWLFPAGNRTTRIYAELISVRGDEDQNTIDSYERAQLFIRRGMRDVDQYANRDKLLDDHHAGRIRIHTACHRGEPVASSSDDQQYDDRAARLDTSYNGISKLGHLKVEDFGGRRPESFYRAAVKAGQREAQEARERADQYYVPSRSSRAEQQTPDDGPTPRDRSGSPRRQDKNPF